MMLNRESQNETNIITVEEAIDCREATRFFSLMNHESGLNVVVSKSSTFISSKLDNHEIVVDRKLYNHKHDTWAIGQKTFQKLTNVLWNCHVRGPTLMLTASNGASSLCYDLNRLNELNCIAKLKSIYLQHQVVYFNLNSAKEKSPIDGHTLVVRCNGNMNRINVEQTDLACQCSKVASILPQSLIGDIPFELMQNNSVERSSSNNNDDLIVCDAIFSLQSTCSLDFLQAELQYSNRRLAFEIRSNHSAQLYVQNSDVSSSTRADYTQPANQTRQSITDLFETKSSSSLFFQKQQQTLASHNLNISGQTEAIAGTACLKHVELGTQGDSNCRTATSSSNGPDQATARFQSTSSLISGCDNGILQTKTAPMASVSATNQPSTILRMRIRVTNFGVCLMPYMMKNYTCKHRFSW